MKATKVDAKGADNAFSKAQLITIANNPVEVASSATGQHTVYVEQEATGGELTGTVFAGDNEAVENITPQFFAKATKGAMAVAYVDSLDWADNNLLSYEFLTFKTSTSADRFIVNGVLSVTTDESFDPFDANGGGAAIKGAFACYTGLGGQMFD